MMSVVRMLTGAVGWVFDLLLAPFASVPALGLLLISVLTSIWALLLFKAVTPQKRLDTTRDHLFGHIYEMGLYQDHLSVLARIQGSLARANLRYLGFTLPALLALTVPMILTLGQLECRFAHRPLLVGESTVVTIEVADEILADITSIDLQTSGGLKVAAGPVRSRRTGTLAWRIEVLADGPQELRFVKDGDLLEQHPLPVGAGLPGLHNKTEKSPLGLLLYPASPVVDESRGLTGLTVQWPERHTSYLGVQMHWLLAFMIISMVAGLLLKGPLKVSF